MSPALAVASAVTFMWLGMVLAISFLEAPLKFRAPDVPRSRGHDAYIALETVKVIALIVTGCLLLAT